MKKLHLCCISKKDEVSKKERAYILVTKKECVATNSNVLAVVPTTEIFTEDFIAEMPERFLVYRDDWAELTKSKTVLEFVDNSIKGFVKTAITINIHTEEEIGRFPQYREAIPLSKDKRDIGQIGINANLLSVLQTALDCQAVELTFFGEARGILVKPSTFESGASGLIMPFIL